MVSQNLPIEYTNPCGVAEQGAVSLARCPVMNTARARRAPTLLSPMRKALLFSVVLVLLLSACNREERAHEEFTSKIVGSWDIQRTYFPGRDSSVATDTLGRWIEVSDDGTLISQGPGGSINSVWRYDPKQDVMCTRIDTATTRPDCWKVDVDSGRMRWTNVSGDTPGFVSVTFSQR